MQSLNDYQKPHNQRLDNTSSNVKKISHVQRPDPRACFLLLWSGCCCQYRGLGRPEIDPPLLLGCLTSVWDISLITISFGLKWAPNCTEESTIKLTHCHSCRQSPFYIYLFIQPPDHLMDTCTGTGGSTEISNSSHLDMTKKQARSRQNTPYRRF